MQPVHDSFCVIRYSFKDLREEFAPKLDWMHNF